MPRRKYLGSFASLLLDVNQSMSQTDRESTPFAKDVSYLGPFSTLISSTIKREHDPLVNLSFRNGTINAIAFDIVQVLVFLNLIPG
ncbi:hypothetical protein B0J14DRAFT_591671 [Halenospora varia]|nr:hypothetical protein B0J14DRAFT_591671 [Halenospora varia]